ncbi:DUF2252 domain-containing protein [Cellulosimicrobium protaetiae]|uniref:DUF2252 domain-containing protein n=1 Tax=Cellulosimicrobium protaetiae TaxID=2587808 RepID=A0A6M5UHC6_9MICO|nr:DUF2252 domain-containing protein [Cellulosimicrobium protaetiae]QJW36029.1 DUF2252 domain-containing protein [Cellulosimicrobium protaetiae]
MDVPRTLAESRAAGRALRDRVPRRTQGALLLPERDPVAVIEEQNRDRLQELVPLRVGRMLESPFAFYRGTAATMAHDLRDGPQTGVHVVACGDAHVSNFGLFASPERRLVFDLNDFDEASDAPWEWDVKRLAASMYVGGRDKGMSEAECGEAAREAVRGYREALADLFARSALERFAYQVETDAIEPLLRKEGRDELRRTVKKARKRTSEQVVQKITTRTTDGRPRIVDQPPVTQHVDRVSVEELTVLFQQYREPLRADVRLLLGQFELVDFVLRVVGVGSVGTRCYILLFEGPEGEPLVLQAKEAGTSVLSRYGGMPDALPSGLVPAGALPAQGRRVVTSQRILQAHSDPFLGWITIEAPERTGRPRVDYFFRQFRDMKGSVELDRLGAAQFVRYGELCGRVLARAHSQSPGARVAHGYLGRSDTFDQAIARWSRAYADVVEGDFATLEAAVASGRVPAERGT